MGRLILDAGCRFRAIVIRERGSLLLYWYSFAQPFARLSTALQAEQSGSDKLRSKNCIVRFPPQYTSNIIVYGWTFEIV